MNTFFVTGLPRSRSAWLANWLTTERSLCLHDVRFDPRLTRPDRRVGFAGPELVDQFDVIHLREPRAPWVVVLRDAAEALESFKRWSFMMLPGAARGKVLEDFWSRRKHALAEICRHSNVYTVAFSQLDEERVARGIWHHVMPDEVFDVERWGLLRELNVQQRVTEEKLKGAMPWQSER